MPYTIQANIVGINAITGLTAENVQQALEQISGTATYAAGAAGTADAKAVAAQNKADSIEGTAQWAANTAGAVQGTVDNYVAPLTGKMDSEMNQVFTALGLTRS